MTQSLAYILIHQLSYAVTNEKTLFNQLTLSLNTEKTGLIGKNGTGKSTLLKLIIGELKPDQGSIQVNGTISYCPQQHNISADISIADLLDVRTKLDALTRIQQGSIDENDFQLVGDDWMVEDYTRQQLRDFGLDYLALDTSLKNLSGGELTRLLLAKAFHANPDFIILDEPTNNLDKTARQFLYEKIIRWEKGLLIVSHDRALLNLMDQLIELTASNVRCYGGNYDHYDEQKTTMNEAAKRELLDAKKSLNQTKHSIQGSREKREQKQSRGKKLFRTGKIDKLTANAKRGRSEKTQSRLVTQGDMLLKNAERQLDTAKSKIEVSEKIEVALEHSAVPNGKVVLDIKDLCFKYNQHDALLIDHFHLQLLGPERIALIGDNGSGKSTLIKLILSELQPIQGTIHLGIQHISYLDQHAHSLNPELSILENFMQLNPDVKEQEAHHALAQFLFRNAAALKSVKSLSGGEKLRAELACALMSKQPPQLLILDEPTNHLDLDSIKSIESALKHYQGAMIVISHDQAFLTNIGIEKAIFAPFIHPAD